MLKHSHELGWDINYEKKKLQTEYQQQYNGMLQTRTCILN